MYRRYVIIITLIFQCHCLFVYRDFNYPKHVYTTVSCLKCCTVQYSLVFAVEIKMIESFSLYVVIPSTCDIVVTLFVRVSVCPGRDGWYFHELMVCSSLL